jgi:leukotriene-A4 hydrolase
VLCTSLIITEHSLTISLQNWPTQQKNVFLETLQNFSKKSLSHPADVFPVPFLELMDRTYSLGASKNAEIMLRWQTLCLESEATWILPSVVDFITSQGRMKFVRPLYRLLRDTSIGKQLAIDTFEANKDM